MSLRWPISAGALFELLRPAAFIFAVLDEFLTAERGGEADDLLFTISPARLTRLITGRKRRLSRIFDDAG